MAKRVVRKSLDKYNKKVRLFWSSSLARTITFIWVRCKGNLPVDNTKKKCYSCLNLSRPARTHEVFSNPNVKLIKMRSYYLTCSEGWLFPIALQEPVAMQLHESFTLAENKEKHSKESNCCIFSNTCGIVIYNCRRLSQIVYEYLTCELKYWKRFQYIIYCSNHIDF